MADDGSAASKFEIAIQDLREAAESFYKIALLVSDGAVRRNGDIAHVKSVLDPLTAGLIDELLLNNISTDADMAKKMKEAVLSLDVAVEKVEELRTSVLDLFGTMLDDYSNALQRVSELSAAQVPIERRRVHSISDPDVRDLVWSITDGRCWYCDVQLIRNEDDTDNSSVTFCVDHLVAKANGGPDHLSNYVPSCRRCNSSKCAKSYVEFKRWRAERANLTVIEGDCAPENGEAA